MNPTFYVIGVGPGDPDLLTIKGRDILRACRVLVVPKGTKNGASTALDIIRPHVDISSKVVEEIYFPMKKIRMGHEPDPEAAQAWQRAAATIRAHIDNGDHVAFPTLGDPAIYSTGFYTCQALAAEGAAIPTAFVPGITAMSACAATTATPLCLGDDMLAVVPATFGDQRLREVLATFETVVLMKIHRVLPRIIALLTETGHIDRATLVERTSTEREQIHRDPRAVDAGSLHYFSTMIVRTR